MKLTPAELTEAVKEPEMRVSLALTRFLAFTNGLEAFTAVAAVLWSCGLWFAQAHGHATDAPVASLAAPMLFLTGTVSLLALIGGHRRIRTLGSALAFQVWAMLTVLTWIDQQPGLSAVGLYGALAIAELALYVRTKLALDVRALQVGDVVQAQLAASTMAAMNFSQSIGAKGTDDDAGRPEKPY